MDWLQKFFTFTRGLFILEKRNLSREDKIKIDFIEKIYSPNGSDRLIKSQSLIKKLKKNKKTRYINPE